MTHDEISADFGVWRLDDLQKRKIEALTDLAYGGGLAHGLVIQPADLLAFLSHVGLYINSASHLLTVRIAGISFRPEVSPWSWL